MWLGTIFKEKVINTFRSYAFVFKEVKKANCFFAWILIFSTLATGFLPVLSKYIFKLITSELEFNAFTNIPTNIATFICISIVYVFLLLLQSIILNLREYINNITSIRLTYNIQAKIIDKIKKIEYKNFFNPQFQNTYKAVLQNCQNQPSVVIFSTALSISSIMHFLSSCAVVAKFNIYVITLLFICFLPSLYINVNIKKGYIKTIDKSVQSDRKIGYFFNVMTEKDFIKEQRLFNLNPFFSLKRKLNFEKSLNLWKQFRKKEFTQKFISAILPSVEIFLSIIFFIFEVIKKNCTISEFIFYSGIIISLKEGFDSLTYNVSYSYESISFIKKFLDFLSLANEIKMGNKKVLNKDIHELEFRNVSFAYPNSTKFALKNINLKFRTGETISLVGKNGCGKTTLINLILRLYDPTEGKILLDNIDIREYDYENYLTFFSAIFQDYQKYAVNIYDYISLGNINGPQDALKAKQAAINASAYSFIKKLPNGFESNLTTLFDKNGLELSGGQWQKLAILRVFLSESSVLIFDEPTSALDSTSESQIYENIIQAGKDKIVIFVSHRMYSSKLAKRIILLEDGKIANDGAHEKMMTQSLSYKKLFEEQANKYGA